MEERFDLSGLWRFSPDPANTGLDQQWMNQENQPYIEEKTREFVPSCWNRKSSKKYASYQGLAWYWRIFRFPSQFSGRKVFLRINGIVHNAIIYIDGHKIGEFKGAFLPFEFDITNIIDDQEHFIAIRIEGNEATNQYLKKTITNPYYGIIGKIELRATEKLILEDWNYTTKLYFKEDNITVNYAELEFFLYLKNIDNLDFNGNIEITLSRNFIPRAIMRKDLEVLKLNSRMMKILIHIDNPELWSPQDPNVLHMNIRVWNGSIHPINIDDIIGIREVKIENNTVNLNGKLIELHGFDYQIDHTDFGYCLPNTIIIDQLKQLKEVHINIIRPNQGIFNKFIIEMASRLGFLVIYDLPIKPLDNTERDTYYKILLEDMKSKPSIICYSINPNIDHEEPKHMKLIQSLGELITGKLDKSRSFISHGYLNAKSWIRNKSDGFQNIIDK